MVDIVKLVSDRISKDLLEMYGSRFQEEDRDWVFAFVHEWYDSVVEGDVYEVSTPEADQIMTSNRWTALRMECDELTHVFSTRIGMHYKLFKMLGLVVGLGDIIKPKMSTCCSTVDGALHTIREAFSFREGLDEEFLGKEPVVWRSAASRYIMAGRVTPVRERALIRSKFLTGLEPRTFPI